MTKYWWVTSCEFVERIIYLKGLFPHPNVSEFYLLDPSHVLNYEPLKIKDNLTYEEIPIQILDRKDHVLRTKTITLVKVLWKNHTVEEASWEREDEMKSKYPELFVNEGMYDFEDDIFWRGKDVTPHNFDTN